MGKSLTTRSTRNPEKPKINYWIISTILLLIFILMGSAWYVLKAKYGSNSNQQPTINKQASEIVVTGVVRTSGLSEEEKQKFGLNEVNYQITDFGEKQKAYQEGQVMGYYLLSDTVIEEFLGKCVRITGTIPKVWKSKNKANAYNRLALHVTNFEKINNLNCNLYSQTPSTTDNTQEELAFRGTVVHGKRPAPDIGYDYQLKLTEPFLDKFSSSGSPQQVSIIDISPTTNDIWSEMENNINKEVDVEGYMVWGYAESRYLSVISVRSSNVTKAINILTAISEVQTIEKSVIKAGRKPFYTPEGEFGDIIRISLLESFPDDPHTNRIDTFNVNIKSNIITVEDLVSGQEISLEEWKKTVKERFQ